MEDLKSADSKDMHYDVLKERMQTVKEKEGEIMEAGHVLEDYLKKQEDKMKSEIVANMLKDKMPEETIVRLAVVSPEFVKQVQATM